MLNRTSRRQFISSSTAALSGLALARPPGGRGDEIEALYGRSVVIDSLSIESWDEGAIDAWKRSGYTAVHTSLPNGNLQVAMRALERWQKRFQEMSRWLIHCRSAADVERAKQEGKLAVMLGFQNATVTESRAHNLDKLHEAGARCVQLTYNARNLLGDGCTERTNAGLSDFGIECVERMNELGIIVDLSHCGEQTSADGIAYSRQPPAFTHTMCKALHFHPRAKSDQLIRALADRGGVTGLVTLGYFVSPDPEATLEHYLDHVDHAVKVAGIDHVGLATDYQIRGIAASASRENWYLPRLKIFKPSYNVRWPPWIPELDPPDRFLTVARGLDARGYTTVQIEKLLGGNWLRYFREVVG